MMAGSRVPSLPAITPLTAPKGAAMESHVENHYHSQNLFRKIQEALKKSDKSTSPLMPEALAAVDQLHTGGAPATLALLKKAGLSKADDFSLKNHVLDAGCGIGGSSRLLAKTLQCRVTGIDLSCGFIETAGELTRLCRLDHCIDFKQGSVLTMPFKSSTFDMVLCQHILMNIQDKKKALKEFHRVLKPGGALILHEIFQEQEKAILLPVPWAADPSISFLVPWEKFESNLVSTGFTGNFFSNETHTALAWWQMVQAAGKKSRKPRPLTPQLVFGANAAFFAMNMEKNFQNNFLQCIEAVYKKS